MSKSQPGSKNGRAKVIWSVNQDPENWGTEYVKITNDIVSLKKEQILKITDKKGLIYCWDGKTLYRLKKLKGRR